MREHNRSFETTYYDPSMQDGVYDVSFELTEDAEDLLFRALEQEISDDVRSGNFADQKIHLYKRLAEQSQSHPPWIENTDGKRVYDLELTEWEYHLISKMVGRVMADILGPEAADKFEELQDAWRSITRQMQTDGKGDVPQYTGDMDRPIQMAGQVDLRDGSRFNIYQDLDSGDEWYICTDCGTSYAEIGDEHVCRYD